MGVLIGVLILVLLIAGLVSRKRSAKAWVKEERFEESGNWLDKRAGERGTWGSLDQEMARDRGQVLRQGRVVELAEVIRQYAADNYPGFSALSEEEVRAFRSYTRSEAAQMIASMEQISKGKTPPSVLAAETPRNSVLKKQVLDFAYQAYPSLLDLDLEAIRQFDQFTGAWADTAMNGLPKLKT